MISFSFPLPFAWQKSGRQKATKRDRHVGRGPVRSRLQLSTRQLAVYVHRDLEMDMDGDGRVMVMLCSTMIESLTSAVFDLPYLASLLSELNSST